MREFRSRSVLNGIMPLSGNCPSVFDADVAWDVGPLLVAIVGIELVAVSITAGAVPVLSIAEIICGVLLLPFVRAMVRRAKSFAWVLRESAKDPEGRLIDVI